MIPSNGDFLLSASIVAIAQASSAEQDLWEATRKKAGGAWMLVSTAKALPRAFWPRQKDPNESASTRMPNDFSLNAFPASLGGNAFLRTWSLLATSMAKVSA